MASLKIHVKYSQVRYFFYIFIMWAAVCCLPFVAKAQSQQTDIRPLAHQLVGDELLAVIKGQTHDGAYNFDRQGIASQFYLETHHADGRITYREDDMVITGAWFIQPDGLCYFYDSPDFTGGCFRVYRVKNCYYFYDKADYCSTASF